MIMIAKQKRSPKQLNAFSCLRKFLFVKRTCKVTLGVKTAHSFFTNYVKIVLFYQLVGLASISQLFQKISVITIRRTTAMHMDASIHVLLILLPETQIDVSERAFSNGNLLKGLT